MALSSLHRTTKMTKTIKKSDMCPLCGDYMDLIVKSCRHKPFIDGKTYPKICFSCWQVPKAEVQTYNDDDSIKNITGPFYDHLHLHTAKELYEEGAANTLKQARNSVRAVKAACRGLRKPVGINRPRQEIDLAE